MIKHARMLALLLALAAPLAPVAPAHAATDLCRRADYIVFHEFGTITWSFWNYYWVNYCDH